MEQEMKHDCAMPQNDVNNPTLIAKAEALLGQCNDVILVSVNEEGYPRPVPMMKVSNKGYAEVWLSTGADSAKVAEFRKNKKAGLCYLANGNCVSLRGDIEIVTDDEIRKRLWIDWFIHHFPSGPTDPNYILLRFVGKEATFHFHD